jgi:uncharacterized membrane protein
MRISSNKMPIDIILCIILSLIFIPLAILDIETEIRIILGVPFTIFIPGYILLSTLFPQKKTDTGLDLLERVILSVGLSLAIVSLIGLGLNYTHYGIRIEPYLISILIYVLIFGFIGIFRWYKVNSTEKFVISLNLDLGKSKSRINFILNILLIIVIITTLIFLLYALEQPENKEKFTSFYILGEGEDAIDYPRTITIAQDSSFNIGLTNHESETIDYTIEIWLINQTTTSNQSDEIIYINMWFVDKITVTLDNQPLDIEKPWDTQWEYNYTLNITEEELKGENLKLSFLLFKESTESYDKYIDYSYLGEGKIESAYRDVHIWINVL